LQLKPLRLKLNLKLIYTRKHPEGQKLGRAGKKAAEISSAGKKYPLFLIKNITASEE
jgi:hypothetical protein